ncbi:MAG: c-type cytochrome, partial [Verrucomicrobiales bacterium]
RGLLLDTLMSRPHWTNRLLEEVKSGDLSPADFDVTRRMQLLNHPDKSLKETAAALFNPVASPGRAEVIARYGSALNRSGDPAKGQLIYRRACASCHQTGNEGLSIGPRLETVVDHPAEKILTNILDPNLDIQPGFHAYSATLKSGEQLFGLLAGEAAAGLTFKTLDAKARNVRRDEVETLQSMKVSLMPEGLEAAVSVEEMADLIAFLKQR